MENKLPTWLVNQLKEKGWTHRELGRRAGVSGAAVSRVISGDQNPGWDFCAAMAKVFGEKPEKMFRLAGLLPGPSDSTKEEPSQEDMLRELYDTLLRKQDNDNRKKREVADLIKDPPPLVPGDEYIFDLFKSLDTWRQRLVYDFARWQLIEQINPIESGGERRREMRYNLALVDLKLAVYEATPAELANFMTFLRDQYEAKVQGDNSGE